MSDNDYRLYLISCGFDAEEVEQKLNERNIMQELYSNRQETREITTATYERADKALRKKILTFIGGE